MPGNKIAFLAVAVAVAVSLCALAACSQAASGPSPAANAGSGKSDADAGRAPQAHPDVKAFCAKLMPAAQAEAMVPLTLFMADDSTSDIQHTGDASYLSCTYDANGPRVTVIMRSDPELAASDKQKGLSPISGFGDQAFSSGEKGGGLHWVDVIRGSDTCEAMTSLDVSTQVHGDWQQAEGRICNAAFTLR